MKTFYIAYWDDELDEPISIYKINAGTLAEAERRVNEVATDNERHYPVLDISETECHEYKKGKRIKIKEVKEEKTEEEK